MTKFDWKILEIKSSDEIITGAKYFVSATDGEYTVETEGNCDIPLVEVVSAFDTVTEEQVAGWVKKETMIGDQNSIELRLQEQLEVLKNQTKVKAPWVKTTFKPTL
jgi:hypothetical protein